MALPCGLVLGNVPGARSARTRALVDFLRPIPAVVLIPLAALLLGPGLRMNVTLIAYAAAWPVLLNTIYGLDDVDPLAKETLRAFGFGRIAVIRRVCLPSAAPFIVTGIRLASSVAIVVSIGVGVVTGRIDGNGIGAFIADASTSAEHRRRAGRGAMGRCVGPGAERAHCLPGGGAALASRSRGAGMNRIAVRWLVLAAGCRVAGGQPASQPVLPRRRRSWRGCMTSGSPGPPLTCC